MPRSAGVWRRNLLYGNTLPISRLIDVAGARTSTGTGPGTDLSVFTAPQGILTMPFANNDQLVFRNAGFNLGVDYGKGTSTLQPIDASLLSPNTNGTFATAGNRFAYDQSTGDLYYDANGSASRASAELIADLTNKPHLTVGSLFFTS